MQKRRVILRSANIDPTHEPINFLSLYYTLLYSVHDYPNRFENRRINEDRYLYILYITYIVYLMHIDESGIRP